MKLPELGEFVRVDGWGDALWEVVKLGERDSADTLSYDPDIAALYLPVNELPRSWYPKTLDVFLGETQLVPEMVVIAMVSNQKERTPVSELLLMQKLKRRLRQKKSIEAKATGPYATAGAKACLRRFKEQNPHLFHLYWDRE